MKTCPKCQETKDLDLFGKDRSRPDGKACWCKVCLNAQNRARVAAQPDKYKRRRRISRYKKLRLGLTAGQYERMADAQEHRCKICQRHRDEFKKDFAVDHNHKTGKIRGLLCAPCNTSIGLMREDRTALATAIKYLEIADG